MNKTQRIQNEATAYIAQTFKTAPTEWITPSRFVDGHGCDGYIFKSEQAARRYILKHLYEFGSDCESAMTDEDWISVLSAGGMRQGNARRIVSTGRWDKVARRILDTNGPEHFLSTYSGQVAWLDDEDMSLLYY